MPELILDKSFLDGAPGHHVAKICNTYTVICSETLFFELISTDPKSQMRCFSKLTEHVNPINLIPGVGALLEFEMEHRKPCVPLFDRRIQGTYAFNQKLKEGTYVLEGALLETFNDWHTHVAEKSLAFLQRSQAVHQFFPELVGIEFRDFHNAVAEAKRKVSANADLVRNIYNSCIRDGAPDNALDASWLDERWAWFRWIQCQILATLRIFERYQCRIPNPPSDGVLLRAEHSMHDADCVLLGALAGNIATGDAEIEEDFCLITPSGTVIKPN